MGKWRWGVILDAGSSGTRIHIYRWLNSARARSEAKNAADLVRLPELQTKSNYTYKIRPGVSSYADNPLDIGHDHLQSLLDHALRIVPSKQVHDTPIFLMATAGMRLLEPVKQKALLDEICSYIKIHTDFSLPDCHLHIQVIPGETEGLYGWLAANYLMKGFGSPPLMHQQHVKNHRTYGFLDMGGASAQIAFAPNSTEAEKHANDLKLIRLRTLDGKTAEYKVFTTTWLGFGVNQARERYVASLKEKSFPKDAHELLDPCLPSGLKISTDGVPVSDMHQGTALVGTGLFDECLRQTSPLLDKDAPCFDQPCLLHGQHVPAIDWNVDKFVGVSEYWHTTRGFFENSDKRQTYNSTIYQKMVRDVCSEEWEDIQAGIQENRWGKDIDSKTAQQFCFKASWIINILHNGIGVPHYRYEESDYSLNGTSKLGLNGNHPIPTTSFQAVDNIGGMEVSWTLGKMLLYATGQIPPANDPAPPVGFGPNLGDSNDFQIAGSTFYPTPDIRDENIWSEAAEELAEQAHSRSTPGFLLFFLLLLILGMVIRKRERRFCLSRVSRRARRSSSPNQGKKGFFYIGGKFLGSLVSFSNDKLLDEEKTMAKFELAQADSDDNDHSDYSVRSRLGRTFARTAQKLNNVTVDSTSCYNDGSGGGSGEAVDIGLISPNANAFHRNGLVSRTESRELSGPGVTMSSNRQIMVAGKRSRTGSPVRGKSPLLSSFE